MCAHFLCTSHIHCANYTSRRSVPHLIILIRLPVFQIAAVPLTHYVLRYLMYSENNYTFLKVCHELSVQ
jgi:hypothetical protein